MSLATKIKLYCKANGVNSVNFLSEVIVLDNGSGAEINEWNLDIAEPTAEQLNSYNSAVTTEENNNVIRGTRKSAYGDIGDQLDLLYKDMLADKGDKTGEWFKAIKAVKDANQKE
tara:strand:- start:111 stop:455 length:345 start_codon:yes stop_codon:yes gene_type:complete